MSKIVSYSAPLIGIIFSTLAFQTLATDIGKVGNWDVDGANGVLKVRGVLTESACRLATQSAFQTVDLGTNSSSAFKFLGHKGTPVPFNIQLEDCLRSESRNHDQQGNITWSSDMPAVRIRFLAVSDNTDSKLIKVNGAEGIALELNDENFKKIKPGVFTRPKLLSMGNNKLTYYITPVRINSHFNAGNYQANIRFQLVYD
ncbi:TPA: type 1 fimbrial protein [Providencia rettgeri]|nr:type 1 fimbrial protein [Providencia rettgeri]